MGVRRYPHLYVIVVTGLLLILAACTPQEGPAGPVGPAGPAGPMGPVGPAGDDATANLEYVGSDRCGECHEEIYARFALSGHPHILTRIEEGGAPEFPFDSITGGIPEPPPGLTWEDISYTIGGFGWKALFVDDRGFIVTTAENAGSQYNFANESVDKEAGWVPYHAGEELPYDCGSCHATGYRSDGHQDDLEGIIGSWAFEGVQCEACHGPGNRHAADPQGALMQIDRSSQLCGECHSREKPAHISAEEGFEHNYQQYSDLFNSKHFALTCVTCHDPHASSRFADEESNPDQGIMQSCESCHWANEHGNVRNHLGVDCIDCHMPPMALSAQGDLGLYRADIRSHQFSINPDPEASQFNEEGTQVMPYLTLQYSCGQCHNDESASVLEVEEMKAAAVGYHVPPPPTATPTLEPTPEATPEGEATPTPQS